MSIKEIFLELGCENIFLAELVNSIDNAIDIGVINTIDIGIDIDKRDFQLLVLILVLIRGISNY